MINALSKLTGKTINEPSEILVQGFTGSSTSSTTGAILRVNEVYSISEGKVVEIGLDTDNLQVVTIQYTPTDLFRYCGLSKVFVEMNDYIIPTDRLGVTSKGLLRFEYCTLEESQYPFRLKDSTYYKHDPGGYLFGSNQLYMSLYAAGQLADRASTEITTSTSQSQSKPSNILSNILPGVV